jgi:hypothetical protein
MKFFLSVFKLFIKRVDWWAVLFVVSPTFGLALIYGIVTGTLKKAILLTCGLLLVFVGGAMGSIFIETYHRIKSQNKTE